MRFIPAIALLSLAASCWAQNFDPGCPAPKFPAPTPTTVLEIDEGDNACAIGGSGSGAETAQNKAKNSFCAQDPPTPITIEEMTSLQQQVQDDKSINFGNPRSHHPLSKKAGPAKDRAPLRALGEGKLRTLEGFVMIARQEGAESVNCAKTVPNAPAFHDIHISLVSAEEQTHEDECASVVAEMVPHHRPASWTKKNVVNVATSHARVRVTGQLFFDSSHTPCIDGSSERGDPRRVSLWELHPIYAFDVCDADDCSDPAAWRSLDAWVKQNP
jgi:hypothetical protein